jgi:hypothetical protein
MNKKTYANTTRRQMENVSSFNMPSDRINYNKFMEAQHQRKNFMRNYNGQGNGMTHQSQTITVPYQNSFFPNAP